MANRNHAPPFWMLAGPACLVLGSMVLMVQSEWSSAGPLWLFGLPLSMGIACLTAFLGTQEVLDERARLRSDQQEQEKKLCALQETLDEAGALYREKVDRLDGELKELVRGYEKIHQEGQRSKTRAQLLQHSLQDALDALRDVRRLDFLKTESRASLPPNLPAQHRQLREQFDEKALVLRQTRRRLFDIEGQLAAKLKAEEEEKLGRCEELDILQEDLEVLDGQSHLLEREVRLLEELVAALLKPQSTRKQPPNKGAEQVLELPFDS